MKKFKIISTCASIVLMIALMAFGVYAASKNFTMSVSGTITYEVKNVYIRVKYGLEGGTNSGDKYTMQDPVLGTSDSLPNGNFTEEADTLTYYVEVENLHNMDIHLRFGFTFNTSSKFSGEAVAVQVTNGTTTYTNTTTNSTTDGVTTYSYSGDTKDMTFTQATTVTYKIKLTLQDGAKDYKLTNCPLNVKMCASLESITDTVFNS